MFGVVLILHILQKGLLVLHSGGYLVFRINIHSRAQLSKHSQRLERIEDVCGNPMHAHHWSDLGGLLGKHLLSYLHSEEQLFLPSSLLLRPSSHHAIHGIEHVIVHCDCMIQCDCKPLRHPKGPISKWPQYFPYILDICQVVLSCEWRLVFAIYWVSKPLRCDLR
jgi:hypothetical protein